jgi:hypothetical protein
MQADYSDKKKQRFKLVKTHVKCMSNEWATHLNVEKLQAFKPVPL